MALISWTQYVMGVAILNFGSEVAFPTRFAKRMFTGHFHWLFPV